MISLIIIIIKEEPKFIDFMIFISVSDFVVSFAASPNFYSPYKCLETVEHLSEKHAKSVRK